MCLTFIITAIVIDSLALKFCWCLCVFVSYCIKWKAYSVPAVAVYYNLPELYNLKHLEMEIDLLDDDHLLPCASFLNAATSLYKFTLKVNFFLIS